MVERVRAFDLGRSERTERLEHERDVDGAGEHRRQPPMAGGIDDRVVEATVGLVDQAYALDGIDVDRPADLADASASTGARNYMRSMSFAAPVMATPPSPPASADFLLSDASAPMQADLDMPAFLKQSASRPAPAAGGGLMGAIRGIFAGSSAPAAPSASPSQPTGAIPTAGGSSAPALYVGAPMFTKAECVLFDTARPEDAQKLPGSRTFSKLKVQYQQQAPDIGTLDDGLVLLLYIDDMALPRARVKLVP